MIRKAVFVILVLVIAAGLRIWTFCQVDGVLPMNGLYVDEGSYATDPTVQGFRGFSRPPGMFVLSRMMDTVGNIRISRMVLSILSLLPALALFLALKDRAGRWLYICVGGLAASPFLILYGLQFLPAVPSAVLLSFALLLASRNRYLSAGFLTGAAALFRAELALIPLVALTFSFRNFLPKWTLFAAGAVLAAVPVILVNLTAGAGPVIAVNGSENLWLGSDWGLLTTPPGTEFEELVAIEPGAGTVDAVFLQRAVSNISSAPLEWIKSGILKSVAYISLPGPGRNIETGWLLERSLLFLLLPLTLLAMSTAAVNSFAMKGEFWRILAVSMILSGLISSFLFFPAARFRTAVLPAFWFLAASSIPGRKSFPAVASAAAVIIALSLLVSYPGMVRPGLTSILAGEHMIASGDPGSALEYLKDAEERGYTGSDIHNLYGTSYSLLGFPNAGLEEFERAIRIAPDSPTLWRNYAVSLWTCGMMEESIRAAMKAVDLNPLLRDELRPILAYGENI